MGVEGGAGRCSGVEGKEICCVLFVISGCDMYFFLDFFLNAESLGEKTLHFDCGGSI